MSKKAIVIAGVAGSGKTTLAQALAAEIGWEYIEADNYHSQAAKNKMASGQPLDDDDRAPWLEKLNGLLQQRTPVVMACSALKQRYRDRLSQGLELQVIWMNIEPELARQRITARTGHFMPPSLVESQFAAAELPQHAVFLDAAKPVEELLNECLGSLGEFAGCEAGSWNPSQR